MGSLGLRDISHEASSLPLHFLGTVKAEVPFDPTRKKPAPLIKSRYIRQSKGSVEISLLWPVEMEEQEEVLASRRDPVRLEPRGRGLSKIDVDASVIPGERLSLTRRRHSVLDEKSFSIRTASGNRLPLW